METVCMSPTVFFLVSQQHWPYRLPESCFHARFSCSLHKTSLFLSFHCPRYLTSSSTVNSCRFLMRLPNKTSAGLILVVEWGALRYIIKKSSSIFLATSNVCPDSLSHRLGHNMGGYWQIIRCSNKRGLMLTYWHDVDMFTWSRIVLSLLECAYVAWKWPISGKIYPKLDWSVKLSLHWLNRELTNRQLSRDGAVGSPYSTAPSSCRNFNLRFAVKTTTFMRDRQIFSPFLKFVFIFWEGELLKPNCLTSDKRELVSHTLLGATLWTNKNLYFCTTVTSQQIQSFRTGITTGSI